MNTIFSKLKTSATLWTVIAGVVVGVAQMMGADGNAVSTIAGAIIVVVPSTAYIISKFCLRIKAADINQDGKVSMTEFANALAAAMKDTQTQADTVKDSIGDIMDALTDADEPENIEETVDEPEEEE